MKGLNTYLVKCDENIASAHRAISAITYGDKTSKKPKLIRVVVRDPRGAHAVLPVSKRCECGGHTFSPIWSGDTFVCQHCGKQYFRKEFEQLPEEGLLRHEVEDRRILAMLLAGGTLYEHAEKSVLVLKNYAGIPEGELPLAYADHLADVYKYASVVTIYHKVELPSRKNALAVMGMGAV